MNKIVKLIISIGLPLAVGSISGFVTSAQIKDWYMHLNKPSWNPPNLVFAPVWTVLYIMMGIALFLVWQSNKAINKGTAITFFTIQLVLNFFWSILFFYFHQPAWAFVEIIALWIAIIGTIFSFAPINKTAAWLLVPYIAWVSFASMLTFAVWQLNK